MSTNFEKFLAGEPLTPELAALKRGELLEAVSPPVAIAPGGRAPLHDAERALKQDERAALREMRAAPGWVVLQRLLERAIITATNAAILASQDDPAGKVQELSNLWLTVKTWKRLRSELNATVEIELLLQEQEAKGVKNGRNEDDTAEQGA